MTEFFNEVAIKNTCRTCLAHNGSMLSIFDQPSWSAETISEIIMRITTIKIHPEDGFPEVICSVCRKATEDAFNFKQLCETSDNFLRKLPQIKLEAPAEGDDILKYEDQSDEEDAGDLHLDDNIKEETWSSDEEICLKDSLDIKDTAQFRAKLLKSIIPVKSKKSTKKKSTKKKHLKNKVKKKHALFKDKIEDRQVLADEDNSEDLTAEGYRKIYQCIKCNGIFKSKNIIKKHFIKLHPAHITSENFHYDLCRSLPSEKNYDSSIDGNQKDFFSNSTAQDVNDLESYKDDLKDISLQTKLNAAKTAYSNINPAPSRSPCYKCEDCDFTCDLFLNLKVHMKTHTGEKSVNCDECNYKCVDVAMLAKHKIKHTGERRYPCPHCSYRSTTPFVLKQHLARHSEVKAFACKQCDFQCKLATSLRQHVARCHEKQMNYPCSVCGKPFYSSTHRTQHMRTHTGERPHVCDQCGKAFAQRSNLLNHVSLKHAEVPPCFPCPQCSHKARSAHSLSQHKLRHSGEKPLQCDKCPYRCISANSLKLHRARHDTVGPLACTQCDFRCHTPGRLCSHVRNHTELRPHACLQCDYRQRHVGDARFSCDTCEYRCYTPCRLRAHMRNHTGERPFGCPHCEYRGKTHNDMRSHLVIHGSEPRLSCPHCIYKTNRLANLKKHIATKCNGLSRLAPDDSPVILPTTTKNNGLFVIVNPVMKKDKSPTMNGAT